jgi:hypothetical protein
MLEYPREEAVLLLGDNLKNAKEALTTLIDDMGYLRATKVENHRPKAGLGPADPAQALPVARSAPRAAPSFGQRSRTHGAAWDACPGRGGPCFDRRRDQITVTEVNMARVFNWDVKERRKKKDAEAKGETVE